MDRRRFLELSSAAVGGLLLGFELTPAVLADEASPKAAQDWAPNAWIRIDAAGALVFILDKTEMGQGVYATLPLLLAEELEVDPEQLRVEFAPADKKYGNPKNAGLQITGASTSLAVSYEPLRRAGAVLRELLRETAAERWQAALADCSAQKGQILHKDGRRLSYFELAEAASRRTLPKHVSLKAPQDFRLIGKSRLRPDSPLKVRGQAVFGLDISIPDLRVAIYIRSPRLGAKLASFRAEKAKSIPGVEDIVAVDQGVAIIAKRYWQARQAEEALDITWDETKAGDFDSAAIYEHVLHRSQERLATLSSEEELQKADIKATYTLPFLAHAAMEPINCTVRLSPELCEIWAPTQSPGIAQSLAADLTKLRLEQVKVTTTFIGGGFGRRLAQDFIEQAVRIAQTVQKPIKLIWSREEDFQHDFYRPTAAHALAITLGPDGHIAHWSHAIAGPSITANSYKKIVPALLPRWIPHEVKDSVGDFAAGYMGRKSRDPAATEGTLDSPYSWQKRDIYFDAVDYGVPVGYWRSVGHSGNAFVIETLMDELAFKAGIDPFVFRHMHLEKNQRAQRVLDELRKRSAWEQALPKGRFRGLAFHESFGTLCAEVVEISVSEGSQSFRVERVTAVVDCGRVVQPNIATAQISGGIVFGLSAALWGDITLTAGRVNQTNFHTYPIARMSDTPPIEVHFLDSEAEPTGLGEPGVPPLAPAIANALFGATKRRFRSLPLTL